MVFIPYEVGYRIFRKAFFDGKLDFNISFLYFDPESVTQKQTQMYVEGFKAKLEKDTSYKGLWTVSFMLKEF